MSTMLLLRWLSKSFNEDMKKCKTTSPNKETNPKHNDTKQNEQRSNS